jgi:glutamine cyclotransferase
VYANVYQSDSIVKIGLDEGKVVQTSRIANAVSKEPQAKVNDEVLNGIAYDIVRKEFLITGKRWWHFYLI